MRRESSRLDQDAAGRLLEGVGDCTPREMTVRVSAVRMPDRTRLTGQHLSVSFLAAPRRHPMRLPCILPLLLAGCVASPSPRTATPPSPTPIPVADSVAGPEVFTPFSWREERLGVSIRTRTIQEDSTALDTMARDGMIRIVPENIGSGVVLAFGSITPAPDTSITAPQGTLVRIRVDTAGIVAVLPDSASGCFTRVPELSPLFLRQLIYPLATAKGREIDSVTDSLRYTSCLQGVELRFSLRLRWTRGPGPRGPQIPFVLDMEGEVHADSTRQLPMTLSGTVFGRSTLVFGREMLQLQRLESEIVSRFEAVTGTRRQRFTQRVDYRAISDSG